MEPQFPQLGNGVDSAAGKAPIYSVCSEWGYKLNSFLSLGLISTIPCTSSERTWRVFLGSPPHSLGLELGQGSVSPETMRRLVQEAD